MAYSVTAYLPGPRSTYADYDVHHRQDPEAAFHLDDCLRRAGRQHTKLDSLERTCEDNLDTCNMYYKNARKFSGLLFSIVKCTVELKCLFCNRQTRNRVRRQFARC